MYRFLLGDVRRTHNSPIVVDFTIDSRSLYSRFTAYCLQLGKSARRVNAFAHINTTAHFTARSPRLFTTQFERAPAPQRASTCPQLNGNSGAACGKPAALNCTLSALIYGSALICLIAH
jgi:hypothetical protein